MNDIILHQATRLQLDKFVARPTHALLLTGPAGIGKTAISMALATAILEIKPESHPYFTIISPDGTSISIEAIRQLQKFLVLKTVGDKPVRRVVVIEHAHTLTTEAQNAFLKLLEEPPADTVMILTATSPRSMLSTILSRTQHVAINTPTEAQLQPLIEKNQKSEDVRRQAYFLSGGLPGLLSALLNEETEHPLLASVASAKEVLQKQPFERLAMVDGLSKQKEAALGVVEALERIAQAGLSGSAQRADTARIKQWHSVRKLALEARGALKRSANSKLVLTNLFLSLH